MVFVHQSIDIGWWASVKDQLENCVAVFWCGPASCEMEELTPKDCSRGAVFEHSFYD